jgi:hypothetical protein
MSRELSYVTGTPVFPDRASTARLTRSITGKTWSWAAVQPERNEESVCIPFGQSYEEHTGKNVGVRSLSGLIVTPGNSLHQEIFWYKCKSKQLIILRLKLLG